MIHMFGSQINRFLPRDAVIVNEGSSTMDIGRTVLLSHYPRQRCVHVSIYEIVSSKRDLTHDFSRFQFFYILED